VQEAPVLRPLSVGDMIDRMLRLIRANIVLFVGIAVVPYLIVEIVQRASGLSQTFDPNDLARLLDPAGPGTFPSRQLQPANPAALAAAGIVAVVVSIILYGALTAAVGERYLGRSITIREAYERGLRAAVPLFFALVAAGIGFIVVFLLLAVALAVFNSSALVVVAVIIGLIAICFVLPWALLSLAVLGPVIVLESLGPIAAIRRSFHLMDRARLRTVGLYLLVGIIASILGLIFSLLFLVSFVADPTIRAVLQTIASVASSTISAPLIYGAFVILYYDLRVRREGLDLQLAAEALPREG
jgi:MFS family permease